MGKNQKKVIALVTVFMLAISGMPTNAYAQSENKPQNTDDPFKMMVDTAPKLMTVNEIIQSAAMQKNSHGKVDITDISLQPSDYDDIGTVQEILGEAIDNLNKNGTKIEINQKLLENILESQQNLAEKSETDRFIGYYSQSPKDIQKLW